MATLPTRTTASFDTIKPVPNLVLLDNEFNQYVGASGILNGGTTATKLLIKTSDATDAPITTDQIGAGLLASFKQNGVAKVNINNDGGISSGAAGGVAPISSSSTTLCTNINADLLDGKHAAQWTTLWAATFYIPDIAARGVDGNFDNIQGALIPGANYTLTHVELIAESGTNTGTFTIDFRKHPFGDKTTQTTLGSIAYNPATPHNLGQGIENDLADHTFTAKDYIYPVISAASSPLQKSVYCTFRGFQTLV